LGQEAVDKTLVWSYTAELDFSWFVRTECQPRWSHHSLFLD